ncbi:otoferlin-like isoform X2 [Planococcus citri]|uniref:otoferlin-like isoform X2 n=1 Tax=Planococcus citri TaxID=170843 RepID=UPI0031F8FABF
MSLNIRVKQFRLAKCKGEKIAKIEFRGVHYFTKILEDRSEILTVDQRFEWKVARFIDSHEQLHIQLFSYSRCLNHRLIGSFSIVLQRLLQVGRLSLDEVLVDSNNQPLPVSVECDIWYHQPDGESSLLESWSDNRTLDEDQQMLIDIGQNIANLEKSFLYSKPDVWSPMVESMDTRDMQPLLKRENSFSSPEVTPKEKKKTSKIKNSVKNLMRIGKQRSWSANDKEELLQNVQGESSRMTSHHTAPALTCNTAPSSDNESIISLFDEPVGQKKAMKAKSSVFGVQNALKSQDFQVCITIIEGRQLAGLNMDPVVCVQVGDIKKYTSVKESTNCPYYNEYFVFDFHMPAVMLFDKIITLTVLHSRKILRSGTVVGSFKIDLRTVYDAPEHQFYHKWALLTDPDDIAGGPKGYLKCDICVIGKGDTIKIPAKMEKDEDDIEGNLLLPDGVPVERQRARFIVKIYRADGLPKMNSSIVANVKKAFTGELKDLVNPYVQVSFAGLTGKTSVKKHCYAPVWNEQIVFYEMFPPLCQRIKIQLRDNDPVNSNVIGTHFVDLKEISNDGEKGFLPTFGPAFIHLYGSTRDYCLIDEHSSLNAGLGEGVSYRGRLLIAVRTEITESFDIVSSEVEIEPTYPITESAYGKSEEFFLFCSILDATMIERKLGEKPLFFEISVGNAGNIMDGHNDSQNNEAPEQSEPLHTVVSTESEAWQSTTPSMKPMTHDRVYYFLPYWDDKPCMYVRSCWPDYRRRMYNSNIIMKLMENLDEGLSEVYHMIETDQTDADRKLRLVLEDLTIGCNKYLSISKGAGSGPGVGKTRLDRERMKMCHKEIDLMGRNARNLKAIVTKHSLKERYKTAQGYLQKLKNMVEDPQHALPDVFLWLVSNGKRYAYQRIAAKDLIFSMVEEECGKFCSKVHTRFLKLPGKKGTGTSGWTIQTKLDIYLWLGLLKHKKYFLNGYPKGYEMTNEVRNIERPYALPPLKIHYTEKYTFQFRAYMYQARSLIGSDASGLSDPFARVIIGEYMRVTQVIDETLSPTWDELLVVDNILLYGSKQDIKKEPPAIVIEIFDQDKVGKSEFLGRTTARPHVKLSDEPYMKPNFPPSLEWYDIHRGNEHAGELLATFELLQITSDLELPELPQPKDIYILPVNNQPHIGPILPVPKGIRPTLAKYRIEVLFWGLRDLKRVHLMAVDRPRVDIECAGNILYSSVIQNAKKNPNFSNPVKFIDLELPEEELYRPPLTIRAVDCRSFGRFTLVGTHMINSVQKYIYDPAIKREKEDDKNKPSQQMPNGYCVYDSGQNEIGVINCGEVYPETLCSINEVIIKMDCEMTNDNKTLKKSTRSRKRSMEDMLDEDTDEDNNDWWTKYFASMEAAAQEEHEAAKIKFLQDQSNMLPKPEAECDIKGSKSKLGSSAASKIVSKWSPKSAQRKKKKRIAKFRIYSNELEAQPEFNRFKEWLLPFDLYRGKKTDEDSEDESRVVGIFKGSIKVYKWPLPKDIDDHTIMGFDPQYGFFQGVPSNDPIHVLVRVYIVKANDLHPTDLNGKADPYIVLQLGSKRISDKDNYISKQLNPVFGKCFEIEATFPQDSMLTIQVLDWDLVGSDDLIGETRIDLENRFYSRHRATCGIAEKYETWRDPMKPTQILAKLCKDSKLEPPSYMNGTVKVGRKLFKIQSIDDNHEWIRAKGVEEQMALAVLHHWNQIPRVGCILVPEHIETRPLYKPDKIGIERGKLEMWVDMFPMDMPLPGPPIDISPRKPKSYVLRVIIWNTDDVVLEDDAFFTGEKMSDIYVKGWLKGPEDCQCTDIHYRSLTGEGNFNWRFIFPFNYLIAEGKIVTSKKESLFSWDESESKIPARLELQVWDADHFSADDFLGALTLDLNRFPRGAKSAKLCTLDMLNNDGTVPMINIFKQKRVKGWWPFYVKKENEEMELTGKVEAELHLLTQEEAEKNPAGQGRSEPDPLDKPNRPDSSFMWFMNPIKSIRYIIWHNYKWTILKIIVILFLAVMILIFFYSIPGYSVKKMLGA